MASNCTALTKAGTPCPNAAIRDGLCFVHHPDFAEKRREASRMGGRNKATEKRVMKKVPSDIRATLEILFETLQGLRDGTVTAAQATAIASVARAICSVWETGVIEAKVREIEERIEGKATGERVA